VQREVWEESGQNMNMLKGFFLESWFLMGTWTAGVSPAITPTHIDFNKFVESGAIPTQ